MRRKRNYRWWTPRRIETALFLGACAAIFGVLVYLAERAG